MRNVSIYYRDSEGIMRKIPAVKVTIRPDGSLFQLYTLSPRRGVILKGDQVVDSVTGKVLK